MMQARHARGAALLSAMLTVALVATFAAAALWQQWRSIEVEAAERARAQSDWVLTGALDWARLILREDGKSGRADHLGEPWAVPLEEARLSSFLAADANNNSSDTADVLDAFMSGQITDLQSLLNVNNLIATDRKASEPDVGVVRFTRLFDQLALPHAQLDTLAENLRFASDKSADNRSGPLAPLSPQRMEQLVWLGVPESTIAALKPYVTILPPGSSTKVNLNTASAEVISAAVPGLSMADAQRLVAVRQRQPFTTVLEAEQAINAEQAMKSAIEAAADVATSFFEVRSRLRLDKLVVEERAVLRRDPSNYKVTVLQRERVLPEATIENAGVSKR